MAMLRAGLGYNPLNNPNTSPVLDNIIRYAAEDMILENEELKISIVDLNSQVNFLTAVILSDPELKNKYDKMRMAEVMRGGLPPVDRGR